MRGNVCVSDCTCESVCVFVYVCVLWVYDNYDVSGEKCSVSLWIMHKRNEIEGYQCKTIADVLFYMHHPDWQA